MVNKLLRFAACFIMLTGNIVSAQSVDSLSIGKTSLKLNIHAGYEYNELSTVKEFFNSFINDLGLKMPAQPVYPYSNVIGGSILISLKQYAYFGLKYEHAVTKAFALYGDPAGTFDIRSSIITDKLLLTGQYAIPLSEYFYPAAEMNMGILKINYDFNGKINLGAPVSASSYYNMTAKDYTILISLLVGLQHPVYKNITIFEKAGYQFSDINSMPAEIESDGEFNNSNMMIKLDFRGVLFQMGLGFQF